MKAKVDYHTLTSLGKFNDNPNIYFVIASRYQRRGDPGVLDLPLRGTKASEHYNGFATLAMTGNRIWSTINPSPVDIGSSDTLGDTLVGA